MTKSRLIKNLLLLTVVSIFLCPITACSSDDNNDANDDANKALVAEENTKYNEYVTPEIENTLKETLGVTINRGINPPNVMGYFLMETNCTKSTIVNDSYVGLLVNNYKIKLHDQVDMKVNLLGYEVITNTDIFFAEHIADGTFITGEGNKFSIFFEEIVNHAGDKYNVKTLSVLSGEVDKDDSGEIKGFKNIQYVFLMKDNDGRPSTMANGSARLYEDAYVDVITKEKFEKLIGKPKSASVKSVSSSSLYDLK